MKKILGIISLLLSVSLFGATNTNSVYVTQDQYNTLLSNQVLLQKELQKFSTFVSNTVVFLGKTYTNTVSNRRILEEYYEFIQYNYSTVNQLKRNQTDLIRQVRKNTVRRNSRRGHYER